MAHEHDSRVRWTTRVLVWWFGGALGLVLLAFFVVPSLLRPHDGCGFRGQCANNLRQIGGLSLLYSQRAGNGYFPFGPGAGPRAHESLNVLVGWDPEAIPHKVFVCPASNEEPAALDPETGRYVLTDDTLSYAWSSRRLGTAGTARPLASDKQCESDFGSRPRHPGGMNVLMTDASVHWVEAGDLPPATQLPDGLTR